jgi:phosphoenolpyruvate carboxylase
LKQPRWQGRRAGSHADCAWRSHDPELSVKIQSVRPEDLPLHEDVRWLAGALGQVIRRLEGEADFQTVESLRRATRARRHDDPGAQSLDDILKEIDDLPLDRAATAARAFTLFFLLINTAEQVHRVRRARDYRSSDAPQNASARWAMQALRAAGVSAASVAKGVAGLEVQPVLTAHPTESTRRTLLGLQARVADLLLARDGAPESERHVAGESLEAEIEMLWITSEVRDDRPTVKDEVSTVLWYLETRLLDASERAREALLHAYEEEYGDLPDFLREVVPLRLGNWVGGDRDGNPNVTPDVTLATARRASYAIMGRYASELASLTERVSASAEFAPPSDELLASIERDRALVPATYQANRQRNAQEPLRLKLSMMEARVEATRRATASRDAGHPVDEPAAYTDASQLEHDLMLVGDCLRQAGATHVARSMIQPVVAMVRAHGLHGFLMDIRDHADALKDDPKKVLDTLAAVRTIQSEFGEAAARTFIISMTRSGDDLLRLLELGRQAGLVDLAADPPRSRLDLVPLFETLDDLERAPDVMRSLLADQTYRRQLAARGNRQEVMIGYSDSSKDAGILAASWALYQGQESLAALFREAGVELTLFHGRGGSVGRGGGSPVARALFALPPGTVDGRIKITEQGEIISQQFGLLPIAERTFEVTLTGVLMQTFGAGQPELGAEEAREFRGIMTALASRSVDLYRTLVHEQEALFTFFRQVTPVEELADARFGSRPSYRPGAKAGIEGIRAIPWGFGWTQIRLMITGWLGVGTALAEQMAAPGGLKALQAMAKRWPFFDDLLSKIEMVCAKTDLEIARAYVTHLGGDLTLLGQLEAEYRRTVDAILRIRQTDVLLSDNDVLRAAIALRNPYVDPLSLLQVSFLRRKRRGDAAEVERDQVAGILATTLSGIAQGLRNTG